MHSLFLCWPSTWSLYLSEIENHRLKRSALGTDTAMHTYAQLQAGHLLRSTVEQQLAWRSALPASTIMLWTTWGHPLLPADRKGQLGLLHLPFWPVLKVCGLHSDALVTLKCSVVNTTVLFTDSLAERKYHWYPSLAFTCCWSWLIDREDMFFKGILISRGHIQNWFTYLKRCQECKSINNTFWVYTFQLINPTYCISFAFVVCS